MNKVLFLIIFITTSALFADISVSFNLVEGKESFSGTIDVGNGGKFKITSDEDLILFDGKDMFDIDVKNKNFSKDVADKDSKRTLLISYFDMKKSDSVNGKKCNWFSVKLTMVEGKDKDVVDLNICSTGTVLPYDLTSKDVDMLLSSVDKMFVFMGVKYSREDLNKVVKSTGFPLKVILYDGDDKENSTQITLSKITKSKVFFDIPKGFKEEKENCSGSCSD